MEDATAPESAIEAAQKVIESADSTATEIVSNKPSISSEGAASATEVVQKIIEEAEGVVTEAISNETGVSSIDSESAVAVLSNTTETVESGISSAAETVGEWQQLHSYCRIIEQKSLKE